MPRAEASFGSPGAFERSSFLRTELLALGSHGFADGVPGSDAGTPSAIEADRKIARLEDCLHQTWTSPEMHFILPLQTFDEKTGVIRDVMDNHVTGLSQERMYTVTYMVAVEDPLIGVRLVQTQMSLPSRGIAVVQRALERDAHVLRDLFFSDKRARRMAHAPLTTPNFNEPLSGMSLRRMKKFHQAKGMKREIEAEGLIELVYDDPTSDVELRRELPPHETTYERARRQAREEIERLLELGAATEGLILESVGRPVTIETPVMHDGASIGARLERTGEFRRATMQDIKRGGSTEPASTLDYLFPVERQGKEWGTFHLEFTIPDSKARSLAHWARRDVSLFRKFLLIAASERLLPEFDIPKHADLAFIEGFEPVTVDRFYHGTLETYE